jgi:CHRD domain
MQAGCEAYTHSQPGHRGHFQEECTMQRFCFPSVRAATRLVGAALLGLAPSAFANDSVEARLKGFAEVPSVSSTASGHFKAYVDRKTGAINYELSYKGLQGEVRQAHIHLGQHGVNGGVMVFLCQTTVNPDPTGLAPTCPQAGMVTGVLQAANVVGPTAQGIDPLEFAELLTAIRGGVAYVNVHSSRFPGGEIRGQLRDED